MKKLILNVKLFLFSLFSLINSSESNTFSLGNLSISFWISSDFISFIVQFFRKSFKSSKLGIKLSSNFFLILLYILSIFDFFLFVF